MKIGILTIPRAQNYGSALQANAMQILLGKYGDVEFIDYMPQFLIGRYTLFSVDYGSVFLFIKSIAASIAFFPSLFKKRRRFIAFTQKYMSFSDEKYSFPFKVDGKYDLIVSGSDQIWNTRITNEDTTFFQDFNTKMPKMAIAVSMGYVDRKDEEVNFYRRHIHNFDYVGVREKTDLEFVKECVKKKAKVSAIIDPTLLIKKEHWLNLVNKRKKTKKYLLIYAFGMSDEMIKTAKEIAEKKGMDIFVLQDSWRKKDKNNFKFLSGSGPIEFLNHVFNADYIITNSFHGTVFSIVFEKNFLTVPYKGTENRMKSLLESLGLEERIFNQERREKFLKEIDYSRVNTILNEIVSENLSIIDGWMSEL